MNKWINKCHFGDCLETLRQMPDGIVQTCVTSPPYFGLRSYLPDGHADKRLEIGLDETPEKYITRLVEVFREVKRVLRNDGTLWLNIGDSYNAHPGQRKDTDKAGDKQQSVRGASAAPSRSVEGIKPKDLIGIPWMLAFALRADGRYLRQDVIWEKPNPMPESVQGSHYSRHTVTIAEYENLSGLQYTNERPGDDWAGDMPSLSEREIFSSKAPLSAKREGASNGESQGRARGCAREASPVQPVGAGFSEQGAIRQDGEGYQDAQSDHGTVQGHAEGENDSGTSPSTHENKSRAHSAEIACGVQLHQESKGQGSFEANVRAAQGSDSFDGQPSDSRGLGIDCGSQSGLVPLLRDASETDAGSCDATEQGWTTHERERSTGLSAVQLQKAGQDTSAVLVGCPGCPKCIQHHGYIFHLSAGRCTKSHEYIFLMSKSEKYYYDNGSIKEPAAPSSIARWNQDIDGQVGSDRVPGKTNGNMKAVGGRSKRDSFKRENSKRAEAIPGQTVGTHRADREESAWDTETRNKRSVWTVATTPYKGAHFATFPPALIEPCILAGAPAGGVVLDPFYGSGTTGQVAQALGRNYIGCELNTAYKDLQDDRTCQPSLLLEAA